MKWHLPSSASAEHRGRTSKEAIREHKVAWEYTKVLPVRLTIDRSGMLQESEIHFEVMQEYSSGARGERIILGNVRLNLAEYVDAGEDGDGTITRRYLMQDSKINSTLKVQFACNPCRQAAEFYSRSALPCIYLRVIGTFLRTSTLPRLRSCSTNYPRRPPLKSAPVFVGIAGIMAAEQGGQGDDFSHMPSMSSKTRELGKLQDMYRRTLAASWAAQDGELPADECVEDIFAGGDGWGKTRKDGKKAPKPSGGGSDSEKSEGTRRTRKTHHRNTSGSDAKHTNNRSKGHSRTSSRSNTSSRTSGINGRVSAEQQVQSSSSDTPAYNWRRTDELDELTAREDLRSWEISAPP